MNKKKEKSHHQNEEVINRVTEASKHKTQT